MKAEKKYELIELDGLNYKINKFTALDGGCVFFFAVKKLLPALKVLDIDTETIKQAVQTENEEADLSKLVNNAVDMITPLLNSITKEELREFEEDCLAQVEVLLDAGYTRLYRDGQFAVEDVMYSPKTVMVLCFYVIRPLLKDFFGENGSGFLSGILNSTSQPQNP